MHPFFSFIDGLRLSMAQSMKKETEVAHVTIITCGWNSYNRRLETLMEKRPVPFSATVLFTTVVVFFIAAFPSSANLSFNFYAASCPPAEFTVRNTVRSASSVDPTVPGKLLRLLFHDCFVEVSESFGLAKCA